MTRFWTTKAGEKIAIRKMGDTHLLNTIKMIKRYAGVALQSEISAAYSCLASLQGEMAQFYCEQDIDRMEQTSVEEWLEDRPVYGSLVREAERRKLL